MDWQPHVFPIVPFSVLFFDRLFGLAVMSKGLRKPEASYREAVGISLVNDVTSHRYGPRKSWSWLPTAWHSEASLFHVNLISAQTWSTMQMSHHEWTPADCGFFLSEHLPQRAIFVRTKDTPKFRLRDSHVEILENMVPIYKVAVPGIQIRSREKGQGKNDSKIRKMIFVPSKVVRCSLKHVFFMLVLVENTPKWDDLKKVPAKLLRATLKRPEVLDPWVTFGAKFLRKNGWI